jgi:hypothetical protein
MSDTVGTFFAEPHCLQNSEGDRTSTFGLLLQGENFSHDVALWEEGKSLGGAVVTDTYSRNRK